MKTTFKNIIAVAITTTALAFPALADADHHKDDSAQSKTGNSMMGGNMMSGNMMGGGGMAPGMMGGGMMGGNMMGSGMMGMTAYDPADIGKIKAKLGITSAQEGVWSEYAAALKEASENARAQHDGVDPKAIQKMDAKERQNFMDSMMAARSEDIKAVTAAKTALFDQLTEEQKGKARSLLSEGSAMGDHTKMHQMMSKMMSHMGNNHHGSGAIMGGDILGLGVKGDRDLSLKDVKDIFEGQIALSGNKRLKVGKVAEKDANTFSAEVVTVDDSVVARYQVDRRNGQISLDK